MKKTIKKEIHLCDKCGNEADYPYRCMTCGTEFCYTCREMHGVTYNHAVHCSGSGDGFYCKSCDAKLSRLGTDKLHNAYRVVKSLRGEINSWHEAFTTRKEAAENAVKALVK